MLKNSRHKALLISTTILVVFASWWLSRPARMALIWHEGQTSHVGQLMGQTTVGQVFSFPDNGMSRLEARFGTYGGWSNGPIKLKLIPLSESAFGTPALFLPGDGQFRPLVSNETCEETIVLKRPDLVALNILVSKDGITDGTLNLVLTSPDGVNVANCSVELESLPKRSWIELQLTDKPEQGLDYALKIDWTGSSKGTVALRSHTDYMGVQRLVCRRKYNPALPLEPVIAQAKIDSLYISDNAFHGFNFKPVIDSAGQAYYFELSAPLSNSGRAVTVWADERHSRGLVMDRVPQSASLSFRAYRSVPKSFVLGALAKKTAYGGGMGFGSPVGLIMVFIIQVGLGMGVPVLLVWRRSEGRRSDIK